MAKGLLLAAAAAAAAAAVAAAGAGGGPWVESGYAVNTGFAAAEKAGPFGLAGRTHTYGEDSSVGSLTEDLGFLLKEEKAEHHHHRQQQQQQQQQQQLVASDAALEKAFQNAESASSISPLPIRGQRRRLTGSGSSSSGSSSSGSSSSGSSSSGSSSSKTKLLQRAGEGGLAADRPQQRGWRRPFSFWGRGKAAGAAAAAAAAAAATAAAAAG
ncbi:hypothetical protein Efla_002145 [Eimeria flavescens]